MAQMTLPETMDLKAAAGLKASILAQRGSPLELDASGVRRLGGLCLQVLLAAASTWRTDGQSFSLTTPSESFAEAIRLFGADAALGTATHGA